MSTCIILKKVRFPKLQFSNDFLIALNSYIQNSSDLSHSEKTNYSRSLLVYANLLNNYVLKNVKVPNKLKLNVNSSNETLKAVSDVDFQTNYEDLGLMLFNDDVIDANTRRKRIQNTCKLLEKVNLISVHHIDKSKFSIRFSLQYLQLIQQEAFKNFFSVEGDLAKIVIAADCSSLLLGMLFSVYNSRKNTLKKFQERFAKCSQIPDRILIEQQISYLIGEFVEPNQEELKKFFQKLSIQINNIMAYVYRSIDKIKKIFVEIATATHATHISFTKKLKLTQTACISGFIQSVRSSLIAASTAYLQAIHKAKKNKFIAQANSSPQQQSNYSAAPPPTQADPKVIGATETERKQFSQSLQTLFS